MSTFTVELYNTLFHIVATLVVDCISVDRAIPTYRVYQLYDERTPPNCNFICHLGLKLRWKNCPRALCDNRQ